MTVDHRHAPSLGLLCLACGTAAALATPTLESALIRYAGASPRTPSHAWTYLLFQIENPDAAPAELQVSVRPESGPVSAFQKTVRVGARAAVSDRLLLTAGATENYTISLSAGGKDIYQETTPAGASPALGLEPFIILDDAFLAEGIGELGKNSALNRRVWTTTIRAAAAPEHWVGYGDVRAIAILAPRFGDLTGAQFEALTDFVSRGGTLLFLDPQGTLAAAGTPLAEMLPIVPLYVRKVEGVPALDAWGAAHHRAVQASAVPGLAERQPLAWRHGTDFLESLPTGEGMTTLADGGYPVCRWRRYGLGTVGVVAISPFTRPLHASACFVPLWNHLFAWASRAPSVTGDRTDESLRRASRLLTGHRVPGMGTILAILVGYLAVGTVLLGYGFRRGRQVWAWLALSGTGLAVTAGLLLAAYRRAGEQPPFMSATTQTCTRSGPRLLSEALVHLYARRDCRPTVAGSTGTTALFRAVPDVPRWPQDNTIPPAPLRLEQAPSGRWSLPRLSVPALKPRLFGVVVATGSTTPVPPAPTLRFTGSGPELIPWRLPDPDRAAAGAFEVYQKGCRRAAVTGAECRSRMLTADFLELDVATVEVARFLGTGLVPAASLALVSRLKGDAPLITTEPDVFGASGYTITLVPLVQEFAGPDLLIPPEHVRVEPASGTPTPAYQIRERLDYVQRASVDTLEYSVFLPATVADLDPREIVVWANVINPGGNITAGVELLRAEYAFAGTETGRQQDSIRPVSESGGKAVFRGTGLSGVVATGSGRFGLVLRTSQKRPIENPTETERANRWRLGSLRVSVAGILPGSPTPRRL